MSRRTHHTTLTSYLDVLDPACHKLAIAYVLTTLHHHYRDAQLDSIACRGKSGMLVAAPVSAITGIQLSIVQYRDSSERNVGAHSNVWSVMGVQAPTNYVIVDDFISSGNTIAEITRALQEQAHKQFVRPMPACKGVILYREHGLYHGNLERLGRVGMCNVPLYQEGSTCPDTELVTDDLAERKLRAALALWNY